MAIRVEPLACIGCQACETACSFYRDEAFCTLSSSIMLVKTEEKKNYFGVVLKARTHLLLGRPEGVERKTQVQLHQEGKGGASAKPILLRQPCDECVDPLCVAFCPSGALFIEP